MDVFVMVKDINQIADNRYLPLYESLKKISRELETEMTPAQEANQGRYVMSLAEIRATDAPLVGLKMANLGEVGAECGFVVPGGFAITTDAFLDFMTNGPLWEKHAELDLYLEAGDSQKFNEPVAKYSQPFCYAGRR
jgi:pyruvate,water dikinase